MTFSLAIIGRPNVGKSTLYNKLAGKKLAIVDDTPGITRDWREAEGMLLGQPLRVIDTAGLEDSFDDSIEARMRQQTEHALEHADAILFMVDGRAGITPLDEHFARWLRKLNLPVIVGINKCENAKASAAAMAEAYTLGLGDPVAMSAEHNIGMEELYDRLEDFWPDADEDDEAEDEERNDYVDDLDSLEGKDDFDFAEHEESEDLTKPLKVAIVGRPNAGKSTLLNTLVGEQRSMTGPEAGITRDAITVNWEYAGRQFRLVDTAGMRKKAKVQDKIEKQSVEDAMRAIRLAQIVVLMIDAENATLEKQDLQIAEHVLEEGRVLVIAVNKWDAVDDRKQSLADVQERVGLSLAQVKNIPIVTLSALKGHRIDKLMGAILKSYDMWNARAGTAALNRWLVQTENQHPAPLVRGRPNRLKYITQIKARPPTFVLWVSKPIDLAESYKRYLTNGLRERFDIKGVPIRILVRTSKNPYK